MTFVYLQMWVNLFQGQLTMEDVELGNWLRSPLLISSSMLYTKPIAL